MLKGTPAQDPVGQEPGRSERLPTRFHEGYFLSRSFRRYRAISGQILTLHIKGDNLM